MSGPDRVLIVRSNAETVMAGCDGCDQLVERLQRGRAGADVIGHGRHRQLDYWQSLAMLAADQMWRFRKVQNRRAVSSISTLLNPSTPTLSAIGSVTNG